MEHKLHHEPVFDLEALRAKAEEWGKRGAKRVCVEWSTGIGPSIYYFPEGERAFGVKWSEPVRTDGYSELYADYIEHKLIPGISGVLRDCGLQYVVRCVDLQPLQVQRQRRRQIERAQAAVAHP
ncbi:MAG: hypothetical protein ACLQVD_04065 [Capsulimonadaceae bacterium]